MLCSSSTTRSRILESSGVICELPRKTMAAGPYESAVTKPAMPCGESHAAYPQANPSASSLRSHTRRCGLTADRRTRQPDQEGAPFGARIVLAKNLARMRVDDSIADTQSQAA